MKGSFLLLPLLSMVTLTSASGQALENKPSPGRGADEKAIKEVLIGFAEAWNRHDAKAFSMVFAEDADFTNVRGMSAHGRGEVEKFHAPLFATRFKDTHQKIADVKIRFLTADIAAVDARWEMTGAKGPDGQELPLRKGLLNLIVTRSAGQWLILIMHNMDLPERPNP